MTKIELFSSAEFQSAANYCLSNIEGLELKDTDSRFGAELKSTISSFLRSLYSTSSPYNESCQFFILHKHKDLIDTLTPPAFNAEWLFGLALLLYEIGYEFDLSAPRRATRENSLVDLLDVNTEKIPDPFRAALNRTRERLPFQIVKAALTSTDIRDLKDFGAYRRHIEEWETKLSVHEKEAGRLEEVLKGFEQTGNFVLLSAGFSRLLEEKKFQFLETRRWVKLFGALVVLPLAIEVAGIFIAKLNGISIELQTLISSAIPIASLTVIAIYFFRIVLRNSDSIRSQILQLEIRRTVCEFVQKYAEFAQSSKESKELLSKFESLIFSNIVPTAEKIPSTFDGLDQISNFIKNLK